MFEKIQTILLYWFAAQQRTSTHTLKKIDWYDVKFSELVKFSAESNKHFNLFFFSKNNRKWPRSGQKMAKTKVVRKNAKRNHLEAKA